MAPDDEMTTPPEAPAEETPSSAEPETTPAELPTADESAAVQDAAESTDKRPTRREARLAKNGAAWTRLALKIAGAVAVVLVVALLGLVGYRMFATQVGAAKQLDSAAVLVEEADSIVVQVDAVVRSDVTTGLADSAAAAAGRVPEAQWALKDALELIEQVERTGGRADKERAGLLREASQARLDMLEQAPAILTLNIQASEAMPLAREGWEAVLRAAKLSDEAVAAYNKLTKSGVKQSSKLNKQAATELATARDRFVKAEAAFPEVPFETYLAYIDTRIELNKLSQQSDAAWLDKDTAKANEIIVRYNELDATGVTQAKALPPSPEQAIAEAFEKAAQEPTNAYYRARDAATAADEALR